MAVITEKSVGDILHQVVDEAPSHVAPKGSLAIWPGETVLVYKNITGGSDWGKLSTQAYGKMYYTGNTAATNPAQDVWNNDDVRTYSAGILKGFTLVTSNHLTLDATEPAALFLVGSTTSIIGASQRKYDVETLPVINNALPADDVWMGSSTANDMEASMATQHLVVISPGEYINFGKRWTNNYGGGPKNGFIIDANTVYAEKIQDLGRENIFTGDFESGDFTGWTVVNGTETNQWVVTALDPASGTYSAHISDDGGTTASYTITSASTTHIYVDVAFPSDGSSFVLAFDWKCTGENAGGDDQYDYGRVFVAPTTVTPVAGTQVDVQYAVGQIKYNLQATYTGERIVLGNTVAGTTQRIVFSWNNDGSVGVDPPFMIDNIMVDVLK